MISCTDSDPGLQSEHPRVLTIWEDRLVQRGERWIQPTDMHPVLWVIGIGIEIGIGIDCFDHLEEYILKQA